MRRKVNLLFSLLFFVLLLVKGDIVAANPPAPAYPASLYQKALAAASSDKTLGKRSIACLVDFSRPSFEKRLWIVNLLTGEILYNTWVSHGKGTGRTAYAKVFSNVLGSECSSLGRFIPAEVFDGKHGLSLRLVGLDAGINDQALPRGIIFHAADYVSEYNANVLKRQGNSQGCFVVSTKDIKKVIDLLKGNSAFIIASV